MELSASTEDRTHPPLNAPTGFRTGRGTASASLREDVWKLRVVRRVAEGSIVARIAGARIRDAMVVCGWVAGSRFWVSISN